jgi:3-oxoadipate enol-lactonase
MGEIISLGESETVYVEDYGSGPGLICIHGLGGGAYFFSGLAEALQDRFRVLTIDLPGVGFSSAGNQAFSLERCAEVVLKIIESRFAEPVSLLGHSMGTIVALKAYGQNPTNICSLIFVGGLPEVLPEAKNRLLERVTFVQKNGMIGTGDMIMPIIFSQQSLRNIPDKVAMYHRLLELNDPRPYAEAATELTRVSATEVMPDVVVPCLAITGTEDHYAPPFAVRAFLEKLPVAARYEEFAGCGHMIFFEAPEKFNRLIGNFLASVS